MKLEVTREVISDLWPLYRTGEASVDSRALIHAFLAEDATFASILKTSEGLPHAMPALRLSPEAERRMLDDARERARLKLLVVGASVAVAAMLFLVALAAVMMLAFRAP